MERPIDVTLFSNSMFSPSSKIFNCFGTSKIFNCFRQNFCRIDNSFIFSSFLSSIFFLLSSTSGKILKAELTNEDLIYQVLLFYFLVTFL